MWHVVIPVVALILAFLSFGCYLAATTPSITTIEIPANPPSSTIIVVVD
jgi:hypothetical protein